VAKISKKLKKFTTQIEVEKISLKTNFKRVKYLQM